MDLRNALAIPSLFGFFNGVIGISRLRETCARHIHAKEGDRILDIGCGTADILAYFPTVTYTGFDVCEAYIRTAQKRFGARGMFFCEELKAGLARMHSDFDLVLALGVLHHLDSDQATQLFKTARAALKPNGRLITLDGCITDTQSALTRFILKGDRGGYVRQEHEYIALAKSAFTNIQSTIYNDILRIPYTHIILECSG